MDIINITGKVEAVKVAQSAALMSLLNELNSFKTVLKDSLKNINDIGNALINLIQEIETKLER